MSGPVTGPGEDRGPGNGGEPGPDPTGDPTGDPASDHDAGGLELARSIARSLSGRAGTARARRGRDQRRAVDPGRASGAHPDDRDPQTLDATIGRLISEQGWVTDVRVHGVFSRWDVIVGREVASHSRPVAFDRGEPGAGGRLTVRTDSTAWATQLRLLAAQLVLRLNQELGDGTVALIEVQGPELPHWKRGLRSVRGGRGPRDTYG